MRRIIEDSRHPGVGLSRYYNSIRTPKCCRMASNVVRDAVGWRGEYVFQLLVTL